MAGVRIYFGGGKPLIRRHREDDPPAFMNGGSSQLANDAATGQSQLYEAKKREAAEKFEAFKKAYNEAHPNNPLATINTSSPYGFTIPNLPARCGGVVYIVPFGSSFTPPAGSCTYSASGAGMTFVNLQPISTEEAARILNGGH